MSTDDHWIPTRITEARAQHPLVTEEVSLRIAEMLDGRRSEQQLSQMDLTRLARALIADMVPKPPKTDLKR